MRRLLRRSNRKWIGASVLVLVLAGLAWVERAPLKVWYCVRELARAGDGDRERWVECVADLDGAALPALFACLGRDDPRTCANVQNALMCLMDRWGRGDARVGDLVGRLAADFADLSTPGRQSALAAAAHGVVAADAPALASGSLVRGALHLLEQAARLPDEDVHTAALDLASALADRTAPQQAIQASRELISACLHDHDQGSRGRAVRLALHPKVLLLGQVVPLLSDPAADIRRAVMAAVGSRQDIIETDDLLPWLHDPDSQVRSLCEEALRLRGLREAHLKLGRLKTDQDPKVRLQVVDYLPYATDLDPGVWLRSLSHDPVPAVRAAAIRAAAEQTVLDLKDRLDQMAQNDPCPTVRQVAQHYLNCQKSEQSPSSEAR